MTQLFALKTTVYPSVIAGGDKAVSGLSTSPSSFFLDHEQVRDSLVNALTNGNDVSITMVNTQETIVIPTSVIKGSIVTFEIIDATELTQ